MSIKLFMVRGGEEVPALSLGPAPVVVGRRPDADLVVDDATVSSMHASLWVDGGRVFIRDHGSRNGTFIDETRVTGIQEVCAGERLRLGNDTSFVVRGRASAEQPAATILLVQDVASGAGRQIVGDRLYIGDSDHAHLHVDGADTVVVSFHADGDMWLSTLDEEVPLEIGRVFAVGDRRFRVVRAPLSPTETVESAAVTFPYRLTVRLDGVSGAEAVLDDLSTGHRHSVVAENRAVLLYVLCKRAVEDASSGAGDDGWCADDDVARDIWGKRGSGDANSLHVLVHRLRKEIKQAGFDPWFIEKRRRAIRVALTDLQVL